ncbi:MAG: flavodoxin family protein [Acidimicrobiales bacterium]
MHAFALNCTLKSGSAPSSTDLLLDQVEAQLRRHEVNMSRERVANSDVRAGVTADEGSGDGWPALRDAVLGADLFVLATPIWMGHAASYAQRVLERLDAFLGDMDDRGQMRTVDRVAMVAVVGNEDGAHHAGADLYQGLNDVGFALAPGAMTYWVGEAMHTTDYKDLDHVPEKTAQATATMVTNAVHLARALKLQPFPPLH